MSLYCNTAYCFYARGEIETSIYQFIFFSCPPPVWISVIIVLSFHVLRLGRTCNEALFWMLAWRLFYGDFYLHYFSHPCCPCIIVVPHFIRAWSIKKNNWVLIIIRNQKELKSTENFYELAPRTLSAPFQFLGNIWIVPKYTTSRTPLSKSWVLKKKKKLEMV